MSSRFTVVSLPGKSMEWRPGATVYCASDDPCVSLRAAQTVEALLMCGGLPRSVREDESGEEKIAEVRMGQEDKLLRWTEGCGPLDAHPLRARLLRPVGERSRTGLDERRERGLRRRERITRQQMLAGRCLRAVQHRGVDCGPMRALGTRTAALDQHCGRQSI
jgi:hypothetical protein